MLCEHSDKRLEIAFRVCILPRAEGDRDNYTRGMQYLLMCEIEIYATE